MEVPNWNDESTMTERTLFTSKRSNEGHQNLVKSFHAEESILSTQHDFYCGDILLLEMCENYTIVNSDEIQPNITNGEYLKSPIFASMMIFVLSTSIAKLRFDKSSSIVISPPG